MPEVADHNLRTAIDALCARLQSDLQTEVAQVTTRYEEERERARRDNDAEWSAKLEAVRQEWHGRLQAGLADAAADADQRLASEIERARRETEKLSQAATEAADRHRKEIEAVRDEWHGRLQSGLADAAADTERRLASEAERGRVEIESLTKAAADAADRHRKEIEKVREEWQGRLQAGIADASADAERRLIAETDRIRREADKAAAESAERIRQEVRKEMELAASASTAQLRTEMEQAATHSTTRLREELAQAAAQATARLREEMDRALATERERANAEIEGERARVQTLLAAERDRSTADIEAERLIAQALSAALEEAKAAVALEREAARERAASLLEITETEHAIMEAQAVVDARVAERQAQLAVVERLLGAVRAIDGGRSLTDTLTNLTHATASVAPRAALFIVANGVNGQELQGWKATGFGDDSPAGLRLSPDDRAARGLLDVAVTTGRAVSTATEPAPAFALLPPDRAALAVPILVGGQSVAVLYADDASVPEPEAPASWPEAIQVLAAHASACLSQITAVRTTQAMHQMAAASGARSAPVASAGGAPAGEEDSSARRYARLLVSEIKLYNEAAVRTGREKRDLLDRLGPEIERARRLYEERVSTAVGARAAYFQQELVHTLADGDSALLGGSV